MPLSVHGGNRDARCVFACEHQSRYLRSHGKDEPTGKSWIVRWREGSAGKWQTCTFADKSQGQQAEDLANAHNHKISDTEVYAIVFGWNKTTVPEPDEQPETPLVED
ncbi:hypothetical protein [Actinoplanes sp. HUAS TT8]|uniref:hypothetical protein n=1 Tax=Actinoplanes sp. HUAS TT8 TaxID=3447453 RepID=UPI003F51D578